MVTRTHIVTEAGLDEFRERELNPEALLQHVERSVHVLLRLPVGVGKTHAAAELLTSPSTYERFDVVVYAAPAWNILREVEDRLPPRGVPKWAVLRARPTELCGDLDPEWRELESRGCGVLARDRLCRSRCQNSASCSWPSQMEKLQRAQLVLMTEQRIGAIRSMVLMVEGITEARRMLVILDEARVLDGPFEVVLARNELATFREVVRGTSCDRPGWSFTKYAWVKGIQELMDCDGQAFPKLKPNLPEELHSYAYYVQERGDRTRGSDFRYIGYDISLLASAQQHERWIAEGNLHFIARPYLKRHLLLLSAHLTAVYAGHRLGEPAPASPFEKARFVHTGSRVINIKSTLGADSYFKRNHPQILDTFAVLILRNISEGRSTLLVSRKKSKERVAEYLTARLRGFGQEVRFVSEGYDELPADPDPRAIPILHYGILGVNNFTEYECAYCVNAYYINAAGLNSAVQEFEPRHFHVRLEIQRGSDQVRRVRLADSGVSDEDRTWLGGVYLKKLEIDPVIQAAGRVRFLTKPREVVFFQAADLGHEVGRCEEVRSLAGLREALGIPSARELDGYLEGVRGRELMAAGFTAGEAADELGVSRRTLFRRLQVLDESANSPLIDSVRKSGTLVGHLGSNGGVA